MADHPVLVIPADTAADLVRTVECQPCRGVGWIVQPYNAPWRDGTCEPCGGTGRVPDPEAPRRLTFPERPMVPCPECKGEAVLWGDSYAVRCTDCTEGVVPLVGGMTVALAVEQCRWVYPDAVSTWSADSTCDIAHGHTTDTPAWGLSTHERRQVVVAVAQVADVIPQCSIDDAWYWCDVPDDECTADERRWVVVLDRVDPCEEER